MRRTIRCAVVMLSVLGHTNAIGSGNIKSCTSGTKTNDSGSERGSTGRNPSVSSSGSDKGNAGDRNGKGGEISTSKATKM